MVDGAQEQKGAEAAQARHVLYPLWAKLGLLLGGATAAAILAGGWIAVREDLAVAEAAQERRLVGLAQAAALLADPAVVASLDDEEDAARPEYQALARGLRGFRDANRIHWVGLVGRRGDRFHYLAECSESDPYPVTLPYFDPTQALRAAFDGTPGYDGQFVDEYGVWNRAYAPVHGPAGAVIGALTLDVDALWRHVLRRQRLRRVWLQTVATSLLALLAAAVFARTTSKGLRQLAEVALAVAEGDLDRRPDVRSRDEVGLLAGILDGMIRGLRERDFIRETFGRYVTPEVVRTLLSDPEALRPGGELREVTILMSDLRGFTSLSERQPLPEVVDVLNGYLGRMADVIEDHGGSVNEFIGDAILAVFGAPIPREDHALRAVACAAKMQIELVRLNRELAERGLPELQMGIGVNTGTVLVGNIGSDRRMKYGVVGDAVNAAARTESFTVGGEVLITESTRWEVTKHVRVRGPIEVQAKGKKEPMRLFALVSVGPPWDRTVPAETVEERTLPHVMLLAELFRVQGKEVAEEPLNGAVVRLGPEGGELVVPDELSIYDDLRLRIFAPTGGGEGPLEDLYGKVTRTIADEEGLRYRFRFTSVPEAERERLAAIAQVED